jgi:hypothetical protein
MYGLTASLPATGPVLLSGLKLEVEVANRSATLSEGLTMTHYNTVAERVFNRAETNALECG